MAALGRRARRAFDEEVRQAVEIARLQQHEKGFFVGQHILAELRAKACEPRGDFAEARLLLGRKPRAGAGEIQMIAFEHAGLFFIEANFRPRLGRPQRFDAGEQRFVEKSLAAVARQDRGHLALDRLQFVGGLGSREIEEHPRDPVEAASAALQRLDGVGECGWLRVLRNGVDVGPRLFERDLESRPEMLRLDACERRRLERSGPRRKKGVVGGGGGHAGPLFGSSNSELTFWDQIRPTAPVASCISRAYCLKLSSVPSMERRSKRLKLVET